MKPAEGSTVIGKSVVIRGDISGQEDLYLDGDIQGTITLKESRLTIGPNAQIRADIHAREVVIFGQLAGNIQAVGLVDLRQSASVKGDIIAGRLSIEESATLSGRVELKAISEPHSVSVPSSSTQSQSSAPLFSQPTV